MNVVRPALAPRSPASISDMHVYKAYDLLNDSDGNGIPTPGDTLVYTVTIVNTDTVQAIGPARFMIPPVSIRPCKTVQWLQHRAL